MNFLKRFGMLILVNALIMITINIILNVLGVQPYLQSYGINYGSLMAFCLVWGFGGAFISLMLSKFMAKMMMGVEIVEPDAREPEAQWLVQTVYRLARNANLSKMPEVGFFQSEEMNAFATGPSRSNSLVAVSTGLMRKMNKDEVEGVLAHEIAHVANGDMVTMTLVQGVVNAFGMFLARVIGHILSTQVKEESAHVVRMISTIILDILFNILGMFVVAAFSRYREYRADAGGAALGGKDKMIRALQRLQQETAPVPAEQPLATFQIADRRSKLLSLLSTHPRLEDRIAKLQAG
ncbi:protease HtpX [Pseudobdellovibrio sp. HCB154]|uniref:protease HtpX n=1 Tax=Pseudobdellovibrio sp. HCB154 TaxID=3386277 RepID=UPI0039176322